MWKWERRDKKKEKDNKNRHVMHKGMKRIENDLENRKKYNTVTPGFEFVDESKNRELKVVRRHDYVEGSWFCEMTNGSVEVLYSYTETFILGNRKA